MKAKLDLPTRLVDYAIGLVSPRRAVIRSHFRRMERDPEYRELQFALLRARGYRAARTDSETATPWASTLAPRSADAETLYALDWQLMRNHARELCRDDPIGSGIVDWFAREIVGTQLRPQSRAPRKVAEAIEAVWLERAPEITPSDRMPFGQWQRMIAHALLQDGEIFVKRAKDGPDDPVWFEAIEAERVRTPSDATPADKEGEIRQGVERDAKKRVVAYWVMKGHPGDLLAQLSMLRAEEFDRVPADAIRHLKLVDRPGQTRGVTGFHAILQDIRDLDSLMLASLKRVQVGACLAAFIESSQAVPDILEVTAENYGFQLRQDLVPGMIFKLYPGEKLQTLLPNFPTPEIETFAILLARRIGSALGVSYQSILHAFDGSNYSSARTTILSDRAVILVFRHLVKEGLLDWMWLTVLEDAVLRGDERVSGVERAVLALCQWIGDAKAWVDPLKEAQATLLKLKAGITTLRDVCAEDGGGDWEEKLLQRLLEEKREIELRAELGLPAKVDGKESAPPAPSTEVDPEEVADEVAAQEGRADRARRIAA